MIDTYRIVRFYARAGKPSRTLRRGLTLAEAQAHCDSPGASSETATSRDAKALTARWGSWFDGYRKEE